MQSSRSYGNIAEDYACELLDKQGYKIIERNFSCKIGEIDIIASDGDTLVFVEVKARWSKKFGKPEEAVTDRKLRKIKKVLQFYLANHKVKFKKYRIDVVALEMRKHIVISEKLIKVT